MKKILASAPRKRRPKTSRKTNVAAPAREVPTTAQIGPGAKFPIAGLGASAGGLEAFEQFFGQVPKACGIAFVVVQHLDPTHKGILVELLQRTTEMPVLWVKDGLRVEPDHVYVIPPNTDLSILR
ncbi:MAG: chemotaxis protein CheB, partial [Pseudomonadota bacterium]